MTEHIHRTIECDVSGEEITNYRNMLEIETVGPSSPFHHGEDYNHTLHISSENHPFDSDRLDHDFRAFVTNTGVVTLIEEEHVYGPTYYYGMDDADDMRILDLFTVLQGVVDDWEVDL